jgi:hypothetical protein
MRMRRTAVVLTLGVIITLGALFAIVTFSNQIPPPVEGTVYRIPGAYCVSTFGTCYPWQAVPLSSKNASQVSGAFSSDGLIQTILLNTSQYSLMKHNYETQGSVVLPSGLEYASGETDGTVINATVPSGTNYLVFLNDIDSNQVDVEITQTVVLRPATPPSFGFREAILNPRTSLSLSPGQYLTVRFQSTSPSLLDGSVALTTTNVISPDYPEFSARAYILTQGQLANYSSNQQFSFDHSTWVGFYSDRILIPISSADRYLVIEDTSPFQNVNITLQHLDIVSGVLSEPNETQTINTLAYPIVFMDSGDLWAGWNVGITLDGESATYALNPCHVCVTQGPNLLSFLEPNGTYDWQLTSIGGKNVRAVSADQAEGAGFIADPSHGAVVVNGRPATVTINFTLVTYAVTFIESGLPSGSSWTVSMNITTLTSTGNTITILEPNYTQYRYSIIPPQGYQAVPSSGIIGVSGQNVTVEIEFKPSAT